jgi:HEAT repeat protein
MYRLFFVLLSLSVAGCGRAGPTLAGGRSVSFWVESLQSPDARVRQKAVDKLGNVGNEDPQAFPAVLGALKDEDPAVRQAAIRALPKFGARAQDGIGALQEVQTSDPDPELRAEATASLQALQQPAKP